ncbi:MAG UNVERIFIED_CONTAM: DUF2309 domain-containing protein [Planctomycetaceae bacterium]|jgi:uncharacterized protein YbcC (UPF0753/DUF2309 family)
MHIKPQEINSYIDKAWKLIAPNWPIDSIIARNPLIGLEGVHFDEAVKRGSPLFQSKAISPLIEKVNKETIKWCQAFFDKGQAIINMPDRHKGFYESWRLLAAIDYRKEFKELKINPLEFMQRDKALTLHKLFAIVNLQEEDIEDRLSMILCSLPGWAGYIKYFKHI